MPENKIYFEPKDPKVKPGHISHAEYSRDFSQETPPFAASREEWETYLFPTGLFKEVKQEKAAEQPVRKEIGITDTGKARDK